MIARALELKEAIGDAWSIDTEISSLTISEGDWKALELVHKFLRVFVIATEFLSSAQHPTLAVAVPAFNYLLDKLEDFVGKHQNETLLVTGAKAAIEKLKEYYVKADGTLYPIGTIIDPRFKLRYYQAHRWERPFIDEAEEMLRSAYMRYKDGIEDDEENNVRGEIIENELLSHLLKRPRFVVRDELMNT